MYAGAYRTNITGATLYNSDVRISNVKYWTKFIENGSLNLHVYDSENSGVSGSYLNVLGLDPDTNPYDITNQNTLALEWNYDNIASSDGSGNFTVQDFSSGSSVIRDNYGWVGDVAGYQHDGYGYGFGPSSTKISDKTRQSSYKFSDPEEVVSDNMINILSEDDTMFEIEQTVPTFVISAEKVCTKPSLKRY